MRFRPGRTVVVSLATALVMLASACKEAPKQEEAAVTPPAPKPAPSMPNIKVTAPVQSKAAAPKPGPNATKKPDTETFGKGKASVQMKGTPHDRSFWEEQLDVDNSGNPVLVDEGWDNRNKVLYVSSDRNFTCGNGQTAAGSTLMAVYAKGNTGKRPVGSGWWVSELSPGACGASTDSLYGCHFDATGNNTDCGEATAVDTMDVTIVPLPQSGSSAPANPSGAGSSQ